MLKINWFFIVGSVSVRFHLDFVIILVSKNYWKKKKKKKKIDQQQKKEKLVLQFVLMVKKTAKWIFTIFSCLLIPFSVRFPVKVWLQQRHIFFFCKKIFGLSIFISLNSVVIFTSVQTRFCIVGIFFFAAHCY